MTTDPTEHLRPASDEPTLAFHGRAAVPANPAPSYSTVDYPATAVPYQRPPRSAAVPILSTLVVIVLLALIAVTGYSASAVNDAHKRQDQLAAQLADEQRRVKELQAQVAAAKAEAQKAQQNGNDDGGKAQQLGSCADALQSVLGARSGSDFAKAFDAMKERCKVAGIPLF
jgi:hypothetical protein